MACRIVLGVSAIAILAMMYPAYQGLSVLPDIQSGQDRLRAQRDEAVSKRTELERELEEVRIRRGDRGGETGGANVLILAGSSREAQAENPRIPARPGHSVQPVLAGFDLTRAGGLQRTVVLRIRIVQTGQTTWEHRCTAREVWDSANHLICVLVPAGALNPGNFEFSITEAAGGAPVYRAPFRVEKSVR